VKSPWLAWGPYTWADGTNPRSDGLTWVPSDFANDGTHPSAQGANKVGQMLHAFFKNHETTRSWYLANP
jgi:lysophospholipase L1-like esterase